MKNRMKGLIHTVILNLFLHTQILLNQYKLEVYDLFHIMLQRLCLLFGRIRLPESGQKNDIITWEKFWRHHYFPFLLG